MFSLCWFCSFNRRISSQGFNEAFETEYNAQRHYAVTDSDLRSQLRTANVQHIMPAYTDFQNTYEEMILSFWEDESLIQLCVGDCSALRTGLSILLDDVFLTFFCLMLLWVQVCQGGVLQPAGQVQQVQCARAGRHAQQVLWRVRVKSDKQWYLKIPLENSGCGRIPSHSNQFVVTCSRFPFNGPCWLFIWLMSTNCYVNESNMIRIRFGKPRGAKSRSGKITKEIKRYLRGETQ